MPEDWQAILAVATPQDMEALGARLVAVPNPRGLVFLSGALGAGKTTLVRGALRGLGFDKPVKSPTFAIVEPYRVDTLRICHVDLYRLHDPGEIEYIGLRDYLDGSTLVFIEWPERGRSVLPPPDVEINIEFSPTGRRASMRFAITGAQRFRRALRVHP